MNGVTAQWVALIGCYVAIIGCYAFAIKGQQEASNHLRTWLGEQMEKARQSRWRLSDKLDDIIERVAKIEEHINQD